jgi:hypothetical protein
MTETVNAEDYKKDELVQKAVDAGLTDAAKYPNKAVIADAINRVSAGEDSATVNQELVPIDTPDGSGAKQSASKNTDKKIHAVNGGHPTQFDETGNPIYDPERV